jgi:hypothetical protein
VSIRSSLIANAVRFSREKAPTSTPDSVFFEKGVCGVLSRVSDCFPWSHSRISYSLRDTRNYRRKLVLPICKLVLVQKSLWG